MRRTGVWILALAAPFSLWAAGGSLSWTPADFTQTACPGVEINGEGRLILKARWDIDSTPISARVYPGFAFDGVSNKALVFGGADAAGNSLGDTWSGDSSLGWILQSSTTAPSARYGHALVSMGGKFFLYGGASSSESWTYDPAVNSWSRIDTQAAPPVNLRLPAMNYLPGKNKIMLFGGGQGDGTWLFDVASSSWSLLSLNPSPEDRVGAAMAWDASAQRVILFGGKRPLTNEYLGDTWIFNPESWTWAQVNPAGSPASRAEAGLIYDPWASGVILFGGRRPESLWDAYFYSPASNQWSEILSSNNNSPPGRFGHGMIYDSQSGRARVLGGSIGATLTGAQWTLIWSTSALCESGAKSVFGTTSVIWSTMTFSGSVVAPGQLRFKLASSSDNATYDDFRGPEGSTGSWYNPAILSTAVWTGNNSRRYLKARAFFEAANPATRPFLAGLSIAYNQAPAAPVLQTPANGTRFNVGFVNFAWQAAADQDGQGDAPILYQIQIASNAAFVAGAVDQANWSASTYSATLGEGNWFWRVQSKDQGGLSGEWSSTFSLVIDTHTPPSAVNQIAAQTGPGNKTITLQWVFPGDDKGSVAGGLYVIRYTSVGAIDNEAAWSVSSERSGLLTAASGQLLISSVTNLADQTTYYFAIQTEDEVGNRSALSSVSPYAMTNASPTVKVISPSGGEILKGFVPIYWEVNDQNIQDQLKVALSITRESDLSYHVLIASGLSRGATFYYWDSRQSPNGTDYHLSAEVVDPGDYSAVDVLAGRIRFDNVNEAPEIVLTGAPSAGQKIDGDIFLSWAVSDPNSYQSHRFNVLLSADSGASYSFVAAYDVTASSLTLDTHAFGLRWGLGNLSTYRIKVVVADSGDPPLTDEAVTPVFEAVVKSGSPLVLTRPLETDFPSVFDLLFEWKAPSEMAGPLSYAIYYSTNANLQSATVKTGLFAVSHQPAVGSLAVDKIYYWQVRARDAGAQEIRSELSWFKISSAKAKTTDRKVLVEVLSGMPEGGFLAFQNGRVASAGAVAQADQYAQGDRFFELLGEPIWLIEARDVQGRALPSADISYKVTFSYLDSESVSPAAGIIGPQYLKIARLNEGAGRWEVLPSDQIRDGSKKEMSANAQGFSALTLVATLSTAEKLSAVTSFPNPFNPSQETAKIRYALNENAGVNIRIYTVLGDLVRVLRFDAGSSGGAGAANGLTNEVFWDGKNGDGEMAANGMYLVRIEAEFASGAVVKTRRIGVLK